MKFRSKAETLEDLKLSFREKINIPEFLFFTKKQLIKNDNLIHVIIKKFKNKKIIIRSSALDEDKLNNSNAGKYDSAIINQLGLDSIKIALKKIFKKLKFDNDKVIFQKLIIEPDIFGVLFTRDINTNAPYYVIDYDKSKKTDLITSGKKSISQKTINILKNSKKIPIEFQNLLKITKKIEKLYKNDCLDIEFAIKKKKIFIFQARPLKKIKKINEKLFAGAIINLQKKIEKILLKDPNLPGSKNALSNMSDWNPAEMIGTNPTKLSFSLYSELITDEVWSKQRKQYNYKDVHPNRLMHDLAGSPYIDLRTDFNSFLPSNLGSNIEKKAIDFYINKIKKKPHLHDKIEFDVVPTCYNFSASKYLQSFLNLKEQKIYLNKLKDINKSVIIKGENNIFKKDIKKIDFLDEELQRFNKIKSSSIQKIFFLVDLCKNYGTLPFSGIARSAFIATSVLRDLQKKSIIKQKELSLFYENINTITNELNTDLYRLKVKKINKALFLKKYGHLRPSTYLITSKSYKDGFNQYFSIKKIKKKENNKRKKKFTKASIQKINKFFVSKKLGFDFNDFYQFASESIKQREYAKYVFTKVINEIFNNLKILGNEMKINLNDLEHISIKTILEAYNNLGIDKMRNILRKEISKNKKFYKISLAIKLPDVITSSKDVLFHYETNSSGNFITNMKVDGKIKVLNQKNIKNRNIKLEGLIICREKADPGIDYIFYHNIKGLVTKYGGPNSHMAIRCMELGIPAAIGMGEKKYKFFSKQNRIEINCQNKKIESLF